MRTSVYRHYAQDGELLYVGISGDPLMRTYQHSHTAQWFDRVAKIELTHFADKASAMEEETRLIKELYPTFNSVICEAGEVVRVRVNPSAFSAYCQIQERCQFLLAAVGVAKFSKLTGVGKATAERIQKLGREYVPPTVSVNLLTSYFKRVDG